MSCSIINKKGMHIQQIMVYLTIKLDKKPIILTYGQIGQKIGQPKKYIKKKVQFSNIKM
jgi:hypothetical protein